jgi:signal peptidase I
VDAVKGLIPGVNFIEWCKLIGRKPTYALLLLIPVVNIFIFTGMAVDLVRSFNKLDYKHTAAAVLYAPAIFTSIALNQKDKYDSPILPREAEYQSKLNEAIESKNDYEFKKLTANNPFKKTVLREWAESLFFAVFAAAFIRMFLIEAYVIPTPSMEGSLNVGDFLFVSKAHYGMRMPMTVAALPLLHNRIPIINKESYLKSPSLGYHRLPALEDIEKGKPIVFNWPVGDSVYITPRRSYWIDQVKDKKSAARFQDPDLMRQIQENNLITRPIDKKDHYIKRCVAVAGDTLQIKNRQIYIDGLPQKNPAEMQFLYYLDVPQGVSLNRKKFEEWGINGEDLTQNPNVFFLNEKEVEKIKSIDPNIKVEFYPQEADANLFPSDPVHFNSWSVDNYGPIWIPKKGASIKLLPENIALYRRVIAVYEKNDYKEVNGKIFINGVESDSYTFKQDYYWAMGDNRHNSEDSRMWGFVPADHIVGKPLFIFFSKEDGGGINWGRIFKSADVD